MQVRVFYSENLDVLGAEVVSSEGTVLHTIRPVPPVVQGKIVVTLFSFEEFFKSQEARLLSPF